MNEERPTLPAQRPAFWTLVAADDYHPSEESYRVWGEEVLELDGGHR